MPLYFAYGSNMDLAAMAVRCPRSTPLCLARLPRHRFGVTHRGYATVVREPRGDVWGLLWTLALSDVPALDRWEEVSKGLYAKTVVSVIRQGGAAVRSLIYVARNDRAPGPHASPEYGTAIIAAARAAGAPEPYISTIAAAFRSPTMTSRVSA